MGEDVANGTKNMDRLDSWTGLRNEELIS